MRSERIEYQGRPGQLKRYAESGRVTVVLAPNTVDALRWDPSTWLGKFYVATGAGYGRGEHERWYTMAELLPVPPELAERGVTSALEWIPCPVGGGLPSQQKELAVKFIAGIKSELAYHKPSDEAVRAIHNVREVCKLASEVITLNVGDIHNRDLRLALDHIADAMMRANRAIVLSKGCPTE
jgi:hypothetical protein